VGCVGDCESRVADGSQELFVVSRASDLATQINRARDDQQG
jgi:hypothetical protein